jgi:acetyltransferase-like isoleucine patch superfamily enzyme
MNSGAANFVGIDRRVSFWVGPNASISIGEGCAISNSTFVSLKSISILPDTFIGGGCEIFDSDFHPLDAHERIANSAAAAAGPVEIGPKAFIGAGCMILKGVRIGEGAVIGAGSVVTRDVPGFELWAGRPARRIRDISNSICNPSPA